LANKDNLGFSVTGEKVAVDASLGTSRTWMGSGFVMATSLIGVKKSGYYMNCFLKEQE